MVRWINEVDFVRWILGLETLEEFKEFN